MDCRVHRILVMWAKPILRPAQSVSEDFRKIDEIEPAKID
jgi:hypothetical protein